MQILGYQLEFATGPGQIPTVCSFFISFSWDFNFILDKKNYEEFSTNWSKHSYLLLKYRLNGSEYSVINMSNDSVEVSFRSSYDPSIQSTKLPLSVDIRLYVYDIPHIYVAFIQISIMNGHFFYLGIYWEVAFQGSTAIQYMDVLQDAGPLILLKQDWHLSCGEISKINFLSLWKVCAYFIFFALP